MTRSAEQIFHEARGMPPSDRAAYLRNACGDDAALRAKVESLLKADEQAGGFMASPTAEVGVVSGSAADAATIAAPLQSEEATLLMSAAAAGDKEAVYRLLPLVYDQLRKAAQMNLAGERANHTLSATALVHEAYLKLVGPREVPWAGKAHFYAAAAEAMRRILIDHARSRRGGQRRLLGELGDVEALAAADSEQIVAVDAAFKRLESEDPDAAAVVRLRFYAGLSVEQAAEALGVSPRTVARLWTYARAVMFKNLGEGS